MTVYLIECGNVLIFYVKERKEYFLLDEHPDYLREFMSGAIRPEEWRGGKKFQMEHDVFVNNTLGSPKASQVGKTITEEDLLKLFYLPDANPGAVIASRDTSQEKPSIYNKYKMCFLDSI